MNDYRNSWSSAVGFYSTHRNSKKEIYRSEEYFLPKILKPGMSVLDVGCAAGGFYNILKELQPDISYTGIDVSREMIQEARRLHPGVRFEKMKGHEIKYEECFDLVFCSGVLVIDLKWRQIIKECWRVTSGYFLFDVRLVEGKTVENMSDSYQKIALEGKWDGKSRVPYVILNVSDLFKSIKELEPLPDTLKAYGYFHQVADTAMIPSKKVCMTMVCIGKIKENGAKPIQWDVPIGLPERKL